MEQGRSTGWRDFRSKIIRMILFSGRKPHVLHKKSTANQKEKLPVHGSFFSRRGCKFALKEGSAKREEKDFPDIVNLAVEHRLDVEADLKPLCNQFADEPIYPRLAQKIREQPHA